jgi:FkbM family methyltransferase
MTGFAQISPEQPQPANHPGNAAPAGQRAIRAVLPAAQMLIGVTARTDAATKRMCAALTAGQYTTRPASFARAEFDRSADRAPRLYRIRGSSVSVAIRHRTVDVGTFAEIFHERIYAPPEEVRRALDRARVDRIVDCGANVGVFASWASLLFPDATITCVEPDKENAAVLVEAARANERALSHPWDIVRAAAGVAAGTATFRHQGDWGSHITSEPGGTRVPVIDVLDDLDGVALLKIDIEGSEWPILADPRLRTTAVRAIALEYHPRYDGDDDAHDAARDALRDAGFSTSTVFRKPAAEGMLWAWRPA